MFKYFILLIMVTNQSYGNWPDYVLDRADEFEVDNEDGFISTIKSRCESESVDLDDIDYYKLSVDSNYFKHAEMDYLIALNETSKKKIIKSPLTFVIPGAFNNLNDNQPRRLLKSFVKKGHHVVVFPNPWGTDYIKKGPLGPLGSVLGEGRSIYNAMKSVFRVLDLSKIDLDNVNVYGVSYGAFLASMVTAFDAGSDKPILTGMTTMVSPPYNLGKTLRKLDYLLDKYNDEYASLGLISRYYRAFKICRKDSDDEMSLQNYKDAKGLSIYMGFHEELIKSILQYDKVWDLKSIPGRRYGRLSKRYVRWERSMSFSTFFNTYSPGMDDLLFENIGQIRYWINKAKLAGNNKHRVLVSDDDFLNERGMWSDLEYKYDSQVLVLEDGGHYGFRNESWFEKLIGL